MKYNFELDMDTRNSLSCIIERLKPNSKVLEFGCANGRLTKYLKEKLHCNVTIIEIDEEAGNMAKQFSTRSFIGEEGNAESKIWSDALNGEKYDFIIFADILEHLKNPKDVLLRAKSNLSDTGAFLVSIPNIANNNIIANLIQNQFVYTETGLLDNTHVTFFTKNTFEKLIDEVGCYLSFETATYINMGNCEVPISFSDISPEIKKVLMTREQGDAYQYIFEFSLHPKDIVRNLESNPEKYFISMMYYKFVDKDLSPENQIIFNSNLMNNLFKSKLQLEEKIDLLRFDFVKFAAMIRINSITINENYYPVEAIIHNAVSKIDNIFIFNAEEPFVFLEIEPTTNLEIAIDYDILDFELNKVFPNQLYTKVIENQKLSIDDKNKNLEQQQILVDNANEKVKNMSQKIEGFEKDVAFLNEKLTKEENINHSLNRQIAFDSNRINTIYHRLKWIWRWVDRDNECFQSDSVDYYVDAVIVSLRRIRVKGWSVARDKSKLSIKGRPTLNIHRYKRDDVNKVWGLDNEYTSGFEVVAFPWLPLRISFRSGANKNVYKINASKLYLKYMKQIIGKAKKSMSERGFVKTIKLCIYKALHKGDPFTDSYEQWFFKHRVTNDALQLQRKHNFAYQPKISIVVPTFNTPANLLNEMINSIKNQSYENWELCIADGHSEKKETIKLLEKLIGVDDRIKIKFLEENYMISGNTNEAIKLTTGDFVALMDHDDLLELDALFEIVSLMNMNPDVDFIYTDEDKINEDGTHFMGPHFKPDYSIDTLRSYNYITHFACIRKSVLTKVGLFDSECDGAQDFDLFLRICDITKNIGHVSKILYHWRICENSTAQSISTKSYVVEAGKHALRKHLDRNELKGTVTDGLEPTLYKVNYAIEGNPLISIVICTKDHIEDLDNCIQSILKKSTYDNYEIIVVENNSEEQRTFEYYNGLDNEKKIRVVYWKDDFNYSAINNFGVEQANGDYVLLLNNDTEVITPNWLEEMLMLAQREDVGVVGSKLLYPDNTVQHAGVIVGLGGVAAHSHRGFPAESVGYVGRMIVVQNISAVTGACMMIKKSKYIEVSGLSEKYKVTYNDVDFCLRVIRAGYTNIMTPFAQMYHYESKSRGMEDTPEKHSRFMEEQKRFKEDWCDILENGDPYYNCNLTLDREDFSLR